MAECMGFFRPEWGMTGGPGTAKRKFRWLFNIENITSGAVDANPLPCIKAARPKLNFREMQAEHMNEVIYYPSKPEWQPIQLSLYDRCISTQNPIFTWLKQQYDPTPARCSSWYPCIDPLSFKPCCSLLLLDGCGNVLESWILEHCYPQNIDWGDLDMSSSDFVTVDFTLRYDRAFQVSPLEDHALYTQTTCVSCVDPPKCGEDGESEGGPIAMRMGIQNLMSVAHMANNMSYTGGTGMRTDYRNVNVNTPDFIMMF